MFWKKSVSFLMAVVFALSLCGFSFAQPASSAPSGDLASGTVGRRSSLSSGNLSYLTPEEQMAYRLLSNAIEHLETEIRLYDCQISVDSFLRVYFAVMDDRPEFFYVSSCAYTYEMESLMVVDVSPVYYQYDKPLEDVVSFFEQETQKILSAVDSSLQDSEKALVVHDYLAAHFSYDLSYSIHEIYGFLSLKKGVCQAYTELYKYLLKSLGMEASSVTSSEMNHTWNIVKIDGQWYHVDVTWDDPVANPEYYGLAQHNNFLLSDEGIRATGHYGWVYDNPAISEPCSDTRYDNYYWKNHISSPIVFCNGKWYFVALGGLFCTEDLNTPLVALTNWSAGGSSYWTSAYAGLSARGNVLYFNSADAILSYDTVSGELGTLRTPEEDEGQIFGMTMDGTSITYTVASTPGDSRVLYTFSLPKRNSSVGDVNTDGKVDAADGTIFSRYMAKWSVTMDMENADINRDGDVNSQDATMLARYLAKWDIPYFD